MKTRVFVQHRLTGLYFKALGSWTQFESEAFQFSSSTSALLYCLRNRLTMTQIVMKFGEARYDIRLPVSDESSVDPHYPLFASP